MLEVSYKTKSSQPFLDRKNPVDQTRLPPSPAGAALLKIFGIVGRNNILACLWVVKHRLGVREEMIEAPVEDAGREERVNVANVETAPVTCISTTLR